MHNTERGGDNEVVRIFGPTIFPMECKSAREYFDCLYRQSLVGAENYFFLGYIDPVTFEPLDEC